MKNGGGCEHARARGDGGGRTHTPSGSGGGSGGQSEEECGTLPTYSLPPPCPPLTVVKVDRRVHRQRRVHAQRRKVAQVALAKPPVRAAAVRGHDGAPVLAQHCGIHQARGRVHGPRLRHARKHAGRGGARYGERPHGAAVAPELDEHAVGGGGGVPVLGSRAALRARVVAARLGGWQGEGGERSRLSDCGSRERVDKQGHG